LVYISCRGFKDFNDCKQGYVFYEKSGSFNIEKTSNIAYIQEYKKEKDLELIADYQETITFSGYGSDLRGQKIKLELIELDMMDSKVDDYGNYIQTPTFTKSKYNLKIKEKNIHHHFVVHDRSIIFVWL